MPQHQVYEHNPRSVATGRMTSNFDEFLLRVDYSVRWRSIKLQQFTASFMDLHEFELEPPYRKHTADTPNFGFKIILNLVKNARQELAGISFTNNHLNWFLLC
jgi:hypothetical protein